jgi:hypothetical protein
MGVTNKETREQKIERTMKLLKCSYDEALQIALDDEAVDKGETMPWDLTEEQKKVSRKARQADRIVSTEKKTRERKADDDKRTLIELLKATIGGVGENVSVTNIEREIEFDYNGRKFKITLSAPRGPKAS